jgi:hypothetical protein
MCFALSAVLQFAGAWVLLKLAAWFGGRNE